MRRWKRSGDHRDLCPVDRSFWQQPVRSWPFPPDQRSAATLGIDEFNEFFNGSVDEILIDSECSQDCFCGSSIFVGEGVFVFAQHGEPTEFQEYVVEHILLLAGDAFDDVHAMTG